MNPKFAAELLDEASKARRSDRRKTKFVFRGKSYVTHQTNFRLFVDTEDGKPVACRYW